MEDAQSESDRIVIAEEISRHNSQYPRTYILIYRKYPANEQWANCIMWFWNMVNGHDDVEEFEMSYWTKARISWVE